MTSYIKLAIECPNCHARLAHSGVASTNNFGGTFFTDGSSWMGADYGAAIAECGACNKPFWMSDAKEIGRLSGVISPREAPIATAIPVYKVQNFERMKFWRTKEEELFLRMESWREANESTRGSSNPPSYTHFDHKNLEALLEIMGESPDEQYLKAEILRNLGRFKESEDLINTIEIDQTSPYILASRKALESGRRSPQEVVFEKPSA